MTLLNNCQFGNEMALRIQITVHITNSNPKTATIDPISFHIHENIAKKPKKTKEKVKIHKLTFIFYSFVAGQPIGAFDPAISAVQLVPSFYSDLEPRRCLTPIIATSHCLLERKNLVIMVEGHRETTPVYNSFLLFKAGSQIGWASISFLAVVM